jgi:hypothetical protein
MVMQFKKKSMMIYAGPCLKKEKKAINAFDTRIASYCYTTMEGAVIKKYCLYCLAAKLLCTD